MQSVKTDISDFYTSRRGTVAILGAGPSVFYVDTQKLLNHDCIYVNSAAILMPKEFDRSKRKIWLSLDRLCMRWSYFWEDAAKGEHIKFVSSDYSIYQDHIAKFNMRYFKTRAEIQITDIYDNKLCGGSSVLAAIDLALKIGYKRILLFGVDQRFVQGKSHFWEFLPPVKRPRFAGGINVSLKDQKKRFEKNVPYFEELKRIALSKDVEILNCGKRTTTLKTFPKLNMTEAM